MAGYAVVVVRRHVVIAGGFGFRLRKLRLLLLPGGKLRLQPVDACLVGIVLLAVGCRVLDARTGNEFQEPCVLRFQLANL